MRIIVTALITSSVLLATPSSAAPPEERWLGMGDDGAQTRELALYLGGIAVVLAVLIAISGGPDDEEPVSP